MMVTGHVQPIVTAGDPPTTEVEKPGLKKKDFWKSAKDSLTSVVDMLIGTDFTESNLDDEIFQRTGFKTWDAYVNSVAPADRKKLNEALSKARKAQAQAQVDDTRSKSPVARNAVQKIRRERFEAAEKAAAEADKEQEKYEKELELRSAMANQKPQRSSNVERSIEKTSQLYNIYETSVKPDTTK